MDGTIDPHAPGGDGHPSAHLEPDEQAPISRLFAEVAAHCTGERITLGEMAEAFGERAFGLLILMLCIPALLPAAASVFGTPMLILGVQMGLGYRMPKLPGFIARRSMSKTDLLRIAAAATTRLKRVERWVKPRPGFFTSPLADKMVGWMTVYTALMLILPGPGTNGPPAFGNIIMSIGVVENDSRVVAIGMFLALLGNIFATGVLIFIGWLGIQALGWVF